MMAKVGTTVLLFFVPIAVHYDYELCYLPRPAHAPCIRTHSAHSFPVHNTAHPDFVIVLELT